MRRARWNEFKLASVPPRTSVQYSDFLSSDGRFEDVGSWLTAGRIFGEVQRSPVSLHLRLERRLPEAPVDTTEVIAAFPLLTGRSGALSTNFHRVPTPSNDLDIFSFDSFDT